MDAPPLFVARSAGPRAPTLRAVNPAAASYLKASAIEPSPLDAIYPSDAPILRNLAPSLTTADHALNPAAIAFALASGLPLEWVYPAPPDASWPAAADYVKRTGKSLADVYPVAPAAPLRWHHVAATVAGILGGALVAGPVGAIAGATLGGAADFAEWNRRRAAA